jgi:exonuclease SbcC
MILNSIMIENIRSYNEEVIDFPRGITLFEGDMASGKSTILMGIEFALFGLGSQKPEAMSPSNRVIPLGKSITSSL